MVDIERVKCVLLGDDRVGKTSFSVAVTTHTFPSTHIPYVHDSWTSCVMVDDKPVNLEIWDTAGSAEYDKLRYLYYDNTDVFVLSFCPTIPDSFHHVKEKWHSEAIRHWPNAQFVLLALKTDLSADPHTIAHLHRLGLSPISSEEALEYAQSIGAYKFLECSSLDQSDDLIEFIKEFARAKFPVQAKSRSTRCAIM